MFSVPPGMMLTSDGRIVQGGPTMVQLGPFERLLPDGRIVYEGPKLDIDEATVKRADFDFRNGRYRTL
ncbi:MAG TPA: hypothetical protein VKS79_21155 [Gemmataceae bacterium]|nr:hypothetical protein [Gemmataceae bacterium]